MSHAPTYQWYDITDNTPLTVVKEYASFTTSRPARYWLVETRNPDNVTSDARLLYRKLTAVPFLVKIVVFAKVNPEGTEARLRIFCITDDNIDKTLERQTGFVEVARSRDVEVCEGRPVHVRCVGNLTPVTREPLQVTFSPFRENRLAVTVRVTDPSQPFTCRLAFLKEPRKDRQGNVRTICNLSIDLSEENLKKGDTAWLPDELLALIGKNVGTDWVALGQQLGLTDSELQEISDRNSSSPIECATDVMKTWRDKEDSEASMASLEKALRDMGRSDIADNFKQLAYSSYSKDPVVIVETRHLSPAKVYTQSSAPDNRRISEFLDSVGESDDMFGGDDFGSPRLQRASVDGEEVFTEIRTTRVESSPEPIIEESVIVVEKHRVVDEDGNVIEETQKIIEDGNEVTEDREKLLQDFFANDKGVLDFLASDKDGTVENGAEETEI